MVSFTDAGPPDSFFPCRSRSQSSGVAGSSDVACERSRRDSEVLQSFTLRGAVI